MCSAVPELFGPNLPTCDTNKWEGWVQESSACSRRRWRDCCGGGLLCLVVRQKHWEPGDHLVLESTMTGQSIKQEIVGEHFEVFVHVELYC